MMRLISALLGLLLLLVIGLAGALLLVRDSSPSLQPMPELSAEQRRWGKELLHESLLDGVGASGEVISLTPADLQILSVLFTEQIRDSRLSLLPGEGSADLMLAWPLPTKLGGWLNLRARLVAPDGVLAIERVEVGKLPVPAALAELLMEQALAVLAIPALPTGIEISPEAIRLQPGALANADGDRSSAMLTADENDLVLVAQRRLAGLSLLNSNRSWIDAAELLSALIASAPADAIDPAAENKAAILALAAYVNGRSLPDPTGAPAPRSIPVRMRDREDIPQHFFTSGALVLQSGSGLANLIGLAKELDDADSASGFNFSDLAANRAGNQFAELATANASSAGRIQQMARSGLSEDDIMPTVDWLPGSMSRATFDRDFGGRDTPAYRIVVDEIDRRIAALPVAAVGE
ncbi:MAG: hypothetical protein C1943_04300 [Halochromatium sp.]|nr:hypothetical protein [Halochromatium sp.]